MTEFHFLAVPVAILFIWVAVLTIRLDKLSRLPDWNDYTHLMHRISGLRDELHHELYEAVDKIGARTLKSRLRRLVRNLL